MSSPLSLSLTVALGLPLLLHFVAAPFLGVPANFVVLVARPLCVAAVTAAGPPSPAAAACAAGAPLLHALVAVAASWGAGALYRGRLASLLLQVRPSAVRAVVSRQAADSDAWAALLAGGCAYAVADGAPVNGKAALVVGIAAGCVASTGHAA